MFQFDYPDTSAYVENYFSKVNTDEEAFWESLSDAYYPYDYFLPMFAAAGNLDGPTLSKLLNETALESTCKTMWHEAIDAWIENQPEKISVVGDTLMEIGYFDDWHHYDWTGVYLHSSLDPYLIRTDTVDEGLTYIYYLQDSLLPGMEDKVGRDYYCRTSDITGEEYYSTDLAVTIDEDLQLSESAGTDPLETIELEGKKVVAFYHNPTAGEDRNAPPSWRILGDFIMGLPEKERPATLAEADYYLVLTSDYQFGNYYQNQSGNDINVQAVSSSTSIDLYDAATGVFLRHLGNVMEEPSSTVVTSSNEYSAKYPELVGADVLSYIYHHINEPDSYFVLLDNTSQLEEPLLLGETGLLGQWEITMNSFEIAQSFGDGLFPYTASDGCRLVMTYFTVTNRGFKRDTFLGGSYQVAVEYPMYAGIIDENGEYYYPAAEDLSGGEYLNGRSLEPGETKEGKVLFEVDENMVGEGTILYIVFNVGNQMIWFSVEQ